MLLFASSDEKQLMSISQINYAGKRKLQTRQVATNDKIMFMLSCTFAKACGSVIRYESTKKYK